MTLPQTEKGRKARCQGLFPAFSNPGECGKSRRSRFLSVFLSLPRGSLLLGIRQEGADLPLPQPGIAHLEPEGVLERAYRLPFHGARVEAAPVHGVASPQGRDDLRDRETVPLPGQLLLDDAEDGEGEVADEEMCLDPVLPREVDGPCLELALPDPEALLDLPPSLVDPDDLLRRVLQVRADRVEAVVPGLLREPVPVPRDAPLLRRLAFRRGVFRLHEAPGVVLVRLPLQASGLHPFQGPCRLSGPDGPLVFRKPRGVGDDHPLPEPPVLEPLLLVQDPVLPFLMPRRIPEGERPLPSEPLPSRVRHQPLPDLLLGLLQRLRDDESEIRRGVVSEVLPAVEASVRAYDELLPPEPLLPLLLQGDHRQLLVRVPRMDAHGDRDPVPVEEPPHLDDGVRTVLLRLPVHPEPVLLFRLEEEVRAVVVDDGRVPVRVLLPSPVGLGLDPVPVLRGQSQRAVDLVEGIVRLLREAGGEGIGRALAERVEDAAYHEVAPDPPEVVPRLAPLCRLGHGLAQARAVVGRLREQVPEPHRPGRGRVHAGALRDLEGRPVRLRLGGEPLRLLLEVGDGVAVLQLELGELPYPLDVLAGGLLPDADAPGIVEYGVVSRLHGVYLHALVPPFRSPILYHSPTYATI